jgi:antitoxin HicB
LIGPMRTRGFSEIAAEALDDPGRRDRIEAAKSAIDAALSTDATMARYSVLLIPDAEVGGYMVRVPAIPANVTEGDNREHALAMAREAIELYLESARDHGWDIPVEDAAPELAAIEVHFRDTNVGAHSRAPTR